MNNLHTFICNLLPYLSKIYMVQLNVTKDRPTNMLIIIIENTDIVWYSLLESIIINDRRFGAPAAVMSYYCVG